MDNPTVAPSAQPEAKKLSPMSTQHFDDSQQHVSNEADFPEDVNVSCEADSSLLQHDISLANVQPLSVQPDTASAR